MTQEFVDIATSWGYNPVELYSRFKEAVDDIRDGKSKSWIQVYKELKIGIKCFHCETLVVDFQEDDVDLSNMYTDSQFCVLCEQCSVIYDKDGECPYK